MWYRELRSTLEKIWKMPEARAVFFRTFTAVCRHANFDWMFWCSYICLSVFPLDYSKGHERILIKFFEGWVWLKDQSIRFLWGSGSRSASWIRITIRFLDPDPEFIYYCDSHRQPRIKHENPRRSFELCECFLVIYCEGYVMQIDTWAIR